MIETKLDDFCRFDWNTIDLPTIKQIICCFQVSNLRNIMHGKQISLDSPTIKQISKL